jgi:hypothetical protein
MYELYVLLRSCTVHLKGIHVKWQLTSNLTSNYTAGGFNTSRVSSRMIVDCQAY